MCLILARGSVRRDHDLQNGFSGGDYEAFRTLQSEGVWMRAARGRSHSRDCECDHHFRRGHQPPGLGRYPENMGSCTWLTENINVNTFLTAESIQVPAGKGVITAVRVKEGDNTGPMKITILRAQGFATSTTPVACCIGAAESQVFTPAADAITTVPVDISVFNGTNPATGVPEVDYMAITVLDDTTDVPLSNVHSEGDRKS